MIITTFAFAHGNKLSPKDLRKIREKYGNEDMLTVRVLDYLRILIATYLIGDVKKEEIIPAIDDSWLSESRLKQLKKSYAKISKLMELQKHNPKFLFHTTDHISNITI